MANIQGSEINDTVKSKKNQYGVPIDEWNRMPANARQSVINRSLVPSARNTNIVGQSTTPTPKSAPTYRAPSAPAPKPTQIIVPVPKAAPVVPTTMAPQSTGGFLHSDAPAPAVASAPVPAPVAAPVDEGPSIQDMIQKMNDAVKTEEAPHFHLNMVPLSDEEMNEPIFDEADTVE